MADRERRAFLKQAGVAGAVALNWTDSSARAAGANNRIAIGVVGCGGRGSGVAQSFARETGCAVVRVCDPDEGRAAALVSKLRALPGGKTARAVADPRKIFDDKSIDAVLVATPDHWHAPASILALDAGKHVYVEKPCSHNLREGRLLVKAARRNKRVVQHGTQSRSSNLIADGIQLLREGIIGDVLVAKAWNVQRRANIGHAKPGKPPAGLDYDLWLGPAPFVPYQKNRAHYTWHWWHAFGTGDMGNDGVHELDYARWGLGAQIHPSRISALGGKLFFDDDQQFPDTMQVAFEYPGDGGIGSRKMLIFEMRIWSPASPFGMDNAVEFYGTQGRLMLAKRGKMLVYGKGNRPIRPKLKAAPANLMNHRADFLDAIRTDRAPNAEIGIGHLSASLCHLGNIAVRVGRTLNFDPAKETFLGDDDANRLLSRTYRDGHWAIPRGV